MDALKQMKMEVCLADGTRIRGTLNIGKYDRLSDFLNSKEVDHFLRIYDASMAQSTGKVIIINRDHIAWTLPEG